jgi:putative thioredoxin
MNELLAIVRQDRSFRQDIGRRSLLALFDLLGTTHPLSVKYRQALAESLN